MIFKFANKTGTFISLRNSETKKPAELVENKTYRYYDHGDDKDKIIHASILPIPINDKTMECIIGLQKNCQVVTKDSIIKVGDTMTVPRTKDDDFLIIGLGEYKCMGGKRNSIRQVKESLYLGVDKIVTNGDTDDVSISKVGNIGVFMDVESTITIYDKYQLIILSVLTSIIIAVITIIVGVDILWKK